MRAEFLGFACAAVLAGTGLVSAQSLKEEFRHPPDSAKPHTWWHWMNGNITREGLTKDIREMKRVGLGGAQIFNVAGGIPAGPVSYLGPQWLDLFRHAVAEAEKVGLEICFHNCAGWSSSGGPWVTPDMAMQRLVWTETRVKGPGRIDAPPAQPGIVRGYYRDVAVLAFPTPPAERVHMSDLDPRVTSSDERFEGKKIVDGNANTYGTLAKPRAGGKAWIRVDLTRALPVRTVTVLAAPGRNGHGGMIQAADEEGTFRSVKTFSLSAGDTPNRARARVTFPPVTAKAFRVVFTRFDARARGVRIAELTLDSGLRIDNWPAKAGSARLDGFVPAAGAKSDPDTAIPLDAIQDLTDRLQPDGRLDWQPPAGDWTILRFGHTCTGKQNHPAPASGQGLEVDKLSREAVDEFWRLGIDPVLDAVGPRLGNTLNNILIDSYEVGYQNWTRTLPEEFARRRGYDCIRFLPACTGRIVEDLERSERFLRDLRTTLADLFHDAYFGGFAQNAHRRGLLLSVEPYGNGNFNDLVAGGRAHIPMTEFWAGSRGNPAGAKQAASIAHTYGRRYVGAESFTASPENGAWRNTPWSLKALGDRMWAFGVNRFIFHRYAHQHWTTVRPGMTMARWGMHFEWTITWWKQARAWTAYLARGQIMLQTGRFVADLLYCAGESSPNSLRDRGGLSPAPPEGYDYDGCSAEILLTRATVREGAIVLPPGDGDPRTRGEGMRYRVLVLPPTDAMTPELANTIREMVRQGAVVVGPKPTRSPSLSGYPDCDDATRAIGAEVWGDCDGKRVTEHAFGSGKVVWGRPLGELMAQLAGGPDVLIATVPKNGTVTWQHRRNDTADWYFLACDSSRFEQVDVSFRIRGRRPELWYPDTGAIEPAPLWAEADGRTRVTVRFEPRGSLFVVFRSPSDASPAVTAVQHDGPPRAAPARPSPNLIIDQAVYGIIGDADDRIDVTEKVKRLVRDGKRAIPATNTFAGSDPLPNVVKELRIDYLLAGKKRSETVPESQTLILPVGAVVNRALYGLTEDRPPTAIVDVTEVLRRHIRDGALEIEAGNALAGDPAHLAVKTLRVDYRLNGAPATLTVRENHMLRLPPNRIDYGTPPTEDIRITREGIRLTAWSPGNYTFTLADGNTRSLRVDELPPVRELTGPWTVRFPPGLGAPAAATFAKLTSWTERPEPGIRYFSGTAEYVRTLDVPAEWLGPGRALLLELGQVREFAEISLNGQAFGVLWKPPFTVDITEAATPGNNELRIRVTNLWPNRLIGDEQLPDDRRWGGDGRMLAWPEKNAKDTPKPANGRVTWTTWRHYDQTSPLLDSGLLGPVFLRPGVRRML